LALLAIVTVSPFVSAAPKSEKPADPSTPVIDLSPETARQVVIAAGTKETYQGHPTTVLLPDGKTMFCVWTLGHGGTCGPMKRSDDAGRSWSDLLPTPASWREVRNCPAIYRLVDPEGKARLVVYAGQGTDGAMCESHSEDDGKTWSEMRSLGLKCVMPFCTITPIDGGNRLLGMTNIRRPGETKDKKSNVIAQSTSDDGGLTWEPWRIVLDMGDLKPCEPWLIRSPDGTQLLALLRENKTHRSLRIVTGDEGATWGTPRETNAALFGDRHAAHYTADGRLFVCFRDKASELGTMNHFVGWLGTYSDILRGKPGQCRIKLLHSYAGGDCGYPGVERLADGTIVATTYIKYRPGEKKQSVVSVRFNPDEIDARMGVMQKANGLWKYPPKLGKSGRELEYDVIIYGGTSGGVAAAVQAARMGKRVAILEPGKHLGGMTSCGLSAVDIGDPRSIGGIAREYFTRLVGKYGKKLAWDEPFKGNGGPATGGAFAIEPHTAEELFDTMAREAGVTMHLDARLVYVGKRNGRITLLGTDHHDHYRAKVFIDATYEGDLMAGAGVTYTITREGNKKYGETYNGIYYDEKYRPRTNHQKPGTNGRVPGGQGVWDRDLPLDPYVVSGDPSSGLLPMIEAGDPGTPGEPAPGVQAYCYRLCLSTADDRLPIEPPKDYDPARYEIVVRFIAGCEAIGDDMDLRWFSKYDPLPNEKFDFNTATFGSNAPGLSWLWPEASYTRRAELAKLHEDYHRGLLHFLATDSRVPKKVRDEMRRFGLPRDEFKQTGGWPHQLYIREARRMVSDLVMTEHHTFGRQVAPKCVSLGSYGTDTHEIRRIVRDGFVQREGKTAGGRDGAPPYPVGYDAIVPKATECTNLFVTFALSASHTAFSSIRMEPVFMATSQSAATAACLAIDANVTVQDVDYAKLEKRLLADGQILAWKDDAKAEKSNRAAHVSKRPDEKEATAPVADAPGSPKDLRYPQAKKASQIDGQAYDLVVVGGTPGGIACAVRAAREGHRVLLVNHTAHLGGMMINGVMQWDALYGGHRSPLFSELLRRIHKYYADTYGEDSRDFKAAHYSQDHYPLGWVEPKVAERLFNEMIAETGKIDVLLSHYPTAVDREGTLLKGVTLCEFDGTRSVKVRGTVFADATYEGDLFALAGCKYRVGREGRDEYNEPHAGKIFCNIVPGPAPLDAVEGRLNIRSYGQKQGSIDPTSPFTADGAVQAYNYRFCLTSDPANRITLEKPPAGYKREEYVNYERKSLSGGVGPNHKTTMNSPILPGENHAYPDADWPTREKISARHRDFALGLMYFLQNDESISESKRRGYREWGLPKDEYLDNNHIPYEMYVRETRRIVGRHVYTEHDGSLAKGFARTPVHSDSVAITDWYMDSHSCTTDSRPGYHYDGKLILTEESRPGQIPYRSLLPREVDNLLVPVCMSTTHVAWGAVRLEPVLMQTGESAGFAAALAIETKTPPARLDADLLVRKLVESRMMVSFFNDVQGDGKDKWVPAVQYFGAKGFFDTYDAKPNAPLTEYIARTWVDALKDIRAGKLSAGAVARKIHKGRPHDGPITPAEFAELLGAPVPHQKGDTTLPRHAAITAMWQTLQDAK
jgi:2-polyprenyl-6-methoxyphenol hydroxylase-like FAD-dependent oxidoreductase